MVKDYGRTVETIERWVGKGLQEGWCKHVPSLDRPDRFRRRFKADLAMDCEDPPTIEVWGRYDRTGRQVKAIFVDVRTRCRKCQNCLNRKSRFWTGRAMDEFAAAPATWLFTRGKLSPCVRWPIDPSQGWNGARSCICQETMAARIYASGAVHECKRGCIRLQVRQ